MNLEALKDNVNEIGQALTSDDVYNGNTLFLNGEVSDYIKNEDHNLIKEHFPASEIKTISGVGHWLHAEKPTEFYKKVTDFIAEL